MKCFNTCWRLETQSTQHHWLGHHPIIQEQQHIMARAEHTTMLRKVLTYCKGKSKVLPNQVTQLLRYCILPQAESVKRSIRIFQRTVCSFPGDNANMAARKSTSNLQSPGPEFSGNWSATWCCNCEQAQGSRNLAGEHKGGGGGGANRIYTRASSTHPTARKCMPFPATLRIWDSDRALNSSNEAVGSRRVRYLLTSCFA